MRLFLKESFVPVLLLLLLLSGALVLLRNFAEGNSRAPRIVRITAQDVATASRAERPGAASSADSTAADSLDVDVLLSMQAGQGRLAAGWVGRAIEMAAHDSLDEALAVLAPVLARNPHDGSAWFARGLVLSRQQDSRGAIEAYETAVRCMRGRAQAIPLYNLACMYRGAGRVDEAATTFQRAIDQRPSYLEARLNLAILTAARPGGRREAEHMYDQLLRLSPTYSHAYYNRGVLELAEDRTDEAVADFRKTVELDPGFGKAWYNLGQIADDRKQNAEAEEAFRMAVQADPKNAKARLNQAGALADLKRYEDAIRVGRETVRLFPEYAAAWYNLALALSEVERNSEARKAYERVLKLESGNAKAWQNLGVLYARDGNSHRAMECYREALLLDAGSLSARYNLALEYRRTGDLVRAIEEAGRLYRLDPDHGKAAKFLRTTAKRLLAKDPGNQAARAALDQIGAGGPTDAP